MDLAIIMGSSPQKLGRKKVQKITPFLWFDNQAEEAVNFYVSLFKNSKINSVKRYGDAGPGPKGSVMIVTFQLEGQDFIALNGGPTFKFTPALSLYVDCVTQEEVDQLWEKLSEGGRKDRCGWLQDKYGLSWQIVPRALQQLMSDPDPKKSASVMQAMLQMDKIDIEALKRAHEKAA
jgi:predicted 3-demethylubiquinone-9 3-methyltransferase (glyoxalase superfamily)